MTEWIDKARRVLEDYISTVDDDRTVSFLQALIDHAPTDSGRRSICESILKCIEKVDKDHSLSDLLYELREHYLTGMIYPMRAKGGKTPKVTEHPSRKDIMEQETMLNEAYLSAAKRDPKKLKNLALLRDDYRSVISGEVDLGTANARGVPPDVGVVATEAAHILPFSLATKLPERSDVCTVLSSFSGWDVATIIGGDEINRLGNVFTLATYEHDAFGQLNWWLEKVEGRNNTYVINWARRLFGIPRGAEVTLTDHGTGLEPPDARLIAIHAACAKVVHQSGMAKFIDNTLRDMEETPVLAEDGSSQALMIALRCIAVN
ncbi:hypothetical protein RSOLAG22IIIB_12221 [Rhizoctonia solani]|uniref:HNH nuclease domain-containing protein n=1 Tax=Rhizoctonia solani TaxID=456999 RepID=A0A0K6GCL3_9AGAM|nr:hypothetical protein RSOLAG22IIIB_12221 [Rhizoctonia solani]